MLQFIDQEPLCLGGKAVYILPSPKPTLAEPRALGSLILLTNSNDRTNSIWCKFPITCPTKLPKCNENVFSTRDTIPRMLYACARSAKK